MCIKINTNTIFKNCFKIFCGKPCSGVEHIYLDCYDSILLHKHLCIV